MMLKQIERMARALAVSENNEGGWTNYITLAIAAIAVANEWNDNMEIAPRGGGPDYFVKGEWIDAPSILLKYSSDIQVVGMWNWDTCEWMCPQTGTKWSEIDGEILGWMHLPPASVPTPGAAEGTKPPLERTG